MRYPGVPEEVMPTVEVKNLKNERIGEVELKDEGLRPAAQ